MPSGPVFSNASLNGHYTYRLSGISYNSTGSLPYQEGGTVVADGNGNITGGADDFLVSSTLSSGPVSGTYSISSDGTGMMNLMLPRGAVTFAITLVSSSYYFLIEYDTAASGDGEALQQTTSAFASTPSGTFVFRLSSALPNSNALGDVTRVGQMILAGGMITGSEDEVNAGVPGSASFTGSIAPPDDNGRGTAALTEGTTQSNFIYYIVDSNTLKFLDADPGSQGGGRADAQSTSAFSNASLRGGFVFRGRGATLSSAFGANSTGVFVADGNGNITSGDYDSVQDGTPSSSTQITGTYAVGSNGRAAITLSPQGASSVSLIVWMTSPSNGLLLVNAPDLAQDGRMDQQSGPFLASTLTGRYAFYSFGDQSQTSPWRVRVGVMTFDGNDTVTFNNYFTNVSGAPRQNGTASGNYSVSAYGRVVAFSIGSVDTQVIYLVSGSSGSLMLAASGSELAGSLGQQTSP